MASTAAALEVSEETTWNGDIEIYGECTEGELEITEPVVESLETVEGNFSASYEAPMLGKYNVTLLCGEEEKNTTFEYKELDFEGLNNITGFEEENIVERFQVIESSENGERVQGPDEVDISIEDASRIYFDEEEWVFQTGELETGDDNLELKASNEDTEILETINLNVESRLNLAAPDEIEIRPEEEKRIGIGIEFEEESLDPEEVSLSTEELSSEYRDGDLVLESQQSVPDRITLKAVYNSFKSEKTINVHPIYTVESRLFDESPFRGSVILESEDEKLEEGLRDGWFSAEVPEGEYDLLFDLEGDIETVEISGLEVEKNHENFIGMKSFESDLIEGIETDLAVAMETEADYDILSLELTSSSSNPEAYRCYNLDFAEFNCNSDWTESDPSYDSVMSISEFESYESGGFLIGDRKEMNPSYSVESETSINDALTGSGTLRDENGDVISGADVKLETESNTEQIQTDSDGNFNFEIPVENGDNSLEVQFEKGLYNFEAEEHQFQVISERLVELQKNNFESDNGEIGIELVNNGDLQESIEEINIDLECDNCSVSHDFQPVTLERYDSKSVNLEIEGLESEVLGEIEVITEGEVFEDSFIVNMKDRETSTSQSQGNNQGDFSGQFYNLAERSNLYLIGNIIAIISAIGLLTYLRVSKPEKERSRPLKELKNEVFSEH